MHPNLPYWLAAMHMHVTPNVFLSWLTHFTTIQDLFAADTATLEKIMPHAQIRKLHNPDWPRVHEDIAWMQKPLHTILTYEDARYPKLLKEIFNPPVVIFIQGVADQLNQLQIAMVGSRRPSVVGTRNAESFAERLASAGLIITSGLARGIDGASHRGALRAKGITFAIAGTGLNHLYPPEHRMLRDQRIAPPSAMI